MKNYSELVKDIQQLYYHASDTMPAGYELHALRLDPHSRQELEMGARHNLRYEIETGHPSHKFRGMEIITEHEVFTLGPVGSAEIKNEPVPIFQCLTIECRQPGRHGRSVYFDYEKVFGPWIKNKTNPELAKDSAKGA